MYTDIELLTKYEHVYAFLEVCLYCYELSITSSVYINIKKNRI